MFDLHYDIVSLNLLYTFPSPFPCLSFTHHSHPDIVDAWDLSLRKSIRATQRKDERKDWGMTIACVDMLDEPLVFCSRDAVVTSLVKTGCLSSVLCVAVVGSVQYLIFRWFKRRYHKSQKLVKEGALV